MRQTPIVRPTSPQARRTCSVGTRAIAISSPSLGASPIDRCHRTCSGACACAHRCPANRVSHVRSLLRDAAQRTSALVVALRSIVCPTRARTQTPRRRRCSTCSSRCVCCLRLGSRLTPIAERTGAADAVCARRAHARHASARQRLRRAGLRRNQSHCARARDVSLSLWRHVRRRRPRKSIVCLFPVLARSHHSSCRA